MSGFRGTTSPGCEANMPGNNFNVKSRKKTSKTGTDAKVTESSYVDCWQKWLKKKIKCARFGRGTQTFLAGEAHFYSMP